MRWTLICICLLSATPVCFAEPNDDNARATLKVLSNNVGIFPAHIQALYPAKLKEKKQHIIADEQQRATLFAEALIQFDGDPDVVLLQEIWSIKARDTLIRDLAEEYPYYKHPPTDDSALVRMQPAGLMIFSRYPLERFAFKEFTKGLGGDRMARKGIAGAMLTKDGHNVAVFTTHLQAGAKKKAPTIRPDQLRECNALIQEFTKNQEDVAIILAGDFNIASTLRSDYEAIFDILQGAKDSYQEGLGLLKKTGRFSDTSNKRIDYLFSFGEVEATSTIVDPAGERISDHLAVFGTVNLR